MLLLTRPFDASVVCAVRALSYLRVEDRCSMSLSEDIAYEDLLQKQSGKKLGFVFTLELITLEFRQPLLDSNKSKSGNPNPVISRSCQGAHRSPNRLCLAMF